MANSITRSTSDFTYDPQISGFNVSFWKTLSGTDPSISSNKIRINNRVISSYTGYLFGEAEFTITVPAAPTASDVRAWGFKSPNLGNRGRVQFDITDTVFKALVYNNTGTALLSQEIPWLSGYTNAAVRYKISWSPQIISFSINESLVASTSVSQADLPLPLHIDNTNADNMDVTAVVLKSARMS